MTANLVKKSLNEKATLERVKSSMWFFKTAKGQYGYGDKFLGVTVPDQRIVAKKFKSLPLVEINKLLDSPFHECRLTALFILVDQYKRASDVEKSKLAKFYLENISHVNNWDLVDSSASQILGKHLLNKSRKVLYKLAKSKTLWDRRISIVSTFAFIDKNQFNDSLAICETLLHDEEDLIHKATGWMLREIGKKSKPTLVSFLDKHAHEMPRTMLRYSIEHFPEKERKHYMTLKHLK